MTGGSSRQDEALSPAPLQIPLPGEERIEERVVIVDIGAEESIPRRASEVATSLVLLGGRTGFYLGRAAVRKAGSTSGGRLLSQMMAGALAAVTAEFEDELRKALSVAEYQIERAISGLIPVILKSLGRADLSEQVNDILDEVDINAILGRIDIDALLARVDVSELARRAKIADLITESTGDLAGSTLDLGRRQAVALDTLLSRAVDRVLGRDPDRLDRGPPALAQQEAGTQ